MNLPEENNEKKRPFLRRMGNRLNLATSQDDNLTSKINNFWHEGDAVVCTRVFRKNVNRCFFCGTEPIERDFVLFNCTSEVTVDADEMMQVNQAHLGAAAILGFIPSLPIIGALLETPDDMDYKTVKSLMDFASEIHTDWGEELLSLAMGMYAERKYYIYESVKEYEEGNNIARIIEEEIQRDFEKVMEQYWEEQSNVYEGYSAEDCLSDDDFAPEGLGSDEIDWDCYYS